MVDGGAMGATLEVDDVAENATEAVEEEAEATETASLSKSSKCSKSDRPPTWYANAGNAKSDDYGRHKAATILDRICTPKTETQEKTGVQR
eukprot:SAG31_NODE_17552_length_666_cov_1.737213_2_plen_91_part_00